GERRVRQPELVANERELHPVCPSQQRDDREPGAGVNELVKARHIHEETTLRAALRRTEASRCGPPRTISTATNTLAIVTGCRAPSADARIPPATVTPASAISPPKISAGVPGPASSVRTLKL